MSPKIDDARPFPIQAEWNWKKGRGHRPVEHNPVSTIPWWLAEEAYEHYVKCGGRGQSLGRLAQRGGFGRAELLRYLRREKG